MSYQLGVDLGTTYSAAAICRDGRVEIAPLGISNPVMPSVVLLRADGEVLTGDTAVRRGLEEPSRVGREFKRRLGDPTPLVLGGTPYAAESLMGHLLRVIVQSITVREGEEPQHVVLTHPATYGPYKLEQLREVSRLAGIDLDRTSFLTEPQAAAISYAWRNRIETGEIVAVYDLGGGTFDVALVQNTLHGFTIVGRPEGMERFGGIDIDAAIVAFVDQSLGGAALRLDPDDLDVQAGISRLREDCRAAKEALSSDTDTAIRVALPGLQTQVRLTRSELESIVRPRLQETVDALERAVKSAELTMDRVSRILLVGGSSRMPLIGDFIRNSTGRPTSVDAHPKFAIALGAAGFGLDIAEQPTSTSPARVPAPLPSGTSLAAADPVQKFEPQPPPPATTSSSRKKVLTIGAVAALVVLGGGAAFALTRSGDSTAVSPSSTDVGAADKSSATTVAPALAEPSTGASTSPAPVTPPVPVVTDAASASENVVTSGGTLNLDNDVSLTMPDGFSSNTEDSTSAFPNSRNISNGTISMSVEVVESAPDSSPVELLQRYIDSFDSLTGSVLYTQALPLAVDESGQTPSDGMYESYITIDSEGRGGFVGYIEVHRRGDGLAYLTDVFMSTDDIGGVFPPDTTKQLHQSFLDAPLLGPVAALTPPVPTRTTTVHETYVVDGDVSVTPPSGWKVDSPGPGLVSFSSPEGQVFRASRTANLFDLEAARSQAAANLANLEPLATFAGFVEEPVGGFILTTSNWHVTNPSGLQASGTDSVWFDSVTGEAFEAFQSWVGPSDEPTNRSESQYLFIGFEYSMTGR